MEYVIVGLIIAAVIAAIFSIIKNKNKDVVIVSKPKVDYFKEDAMNYLENIKTVASGIQSYGDWLKYLASIDNDIINYSYVPEFFTELNNIRVEVKNKFNQ